MDPHLCSWCDLNRLTVIQVRRHVGGCADCSTSSLGSSLMAFAARGIWGSMALVVDKGPKGAACACRSLLGRRVNHVG